MEVCFFMQQRCTFVAFVFINRDVSKQHSVRIIHWGYLTLKFLNIIIWGYNNEIIR
jgi:hypothetical protein